MRMFTAARLDDLVREAARSTRRRNNLNIHPTLDDPIQRFFNAMEPGTYVRPHRHGATRWELFVVLRGRAVVLTFGAEATVDARAELSPEGPTLAVEIEGGVWHTVAALAGGTILLEIKPGPYHPVEDKDFASWAPREDQPAAARAEAWFCSARPGSVWRRPGGPPEFLMMRRRGEGAED